VLRDHLTNFLNQWISPNDLLKSVEFDINEKIYLAEIRALGIIDKIITGPLWHLQKLRKHHYPIFVVFPSKLISKDSTTICYLFFQGDATKVL
jgi:hypothetical protein